MNIPDYRRLALQRQGLDRSRPFGRGLTATLRAIEHLGYVQIDTIAVVERAHHHILWTRNPDYRPEHLNRLLTQGKIFEHWAHAAAYLPMRDYRFATIRMARIRDSGHPWFAAVDQRLTLNILAQIRERGPSRLRDLGNHHQQTPDNWWNWTPARRAIDKLFLQGDLMVCARDGMEKIYDLRERVLPPDIDTRTPTTPEYAAYLLDSALRAHGIISLKQVLHLQSDPALKKAVQALIAERIDQGELLPAAPWRDIWLPAADATPQRKPPATLRILSPFDNLLIHRERTRQLFAFDYRLECYLPAAKRQYGYFALPLLYGDQLVGSIDCKAQRREKRLDILQLHLAEHAPKAATLTRALAQSLKRFAAFNGCDAVNWRSPSPLAAI